MICTAEDEDGEVGEELGKTGGLVGSWRRDQDGDAARQDLVADLGVKTAGPS